MNGYLMKALEKKKIWKFIIAGVEINIVHLVCNSN